MYFLSSKHCKFTPKCLPYPMAKLVSMMYKDLQECRMIYKMVANRIVVVDNSPIIFRIYITFAILLLQSGYSLIPQNKQKITRIRSKGWANQHDVIGLILWSFTHSQSLWHFWRRKSRQNFRKFYETRFKVQNRELNLSKDQSQFDKSLCHKHLKIICTIYNARSYFV